MKSTRKIIFVIPWYGKDATGGAELQCRTLAEHLKGVGLDIEIFTTCSRQFNSAWINDFKLGKYQEDGLLVHRFRVDQRDSSLFGYLNDRILSTGRIKEDEELSFFQNSINSKDMMDAIAKDSESLFVFIPYLYGTTIFGCQIHPERSIMIPCLHDENYTKMSLVKKVLSHVRAIAFNSSSERDFALSLLRNLPYNEILGEGIDPVSKYDDLDSFKQKFNLKDFILCAGRKESGKNTPLLVEYFVKFLQRNNTDLKLVLTGKGQMDMLAPYSKNIVDVFLTKDDLSRAYSTASILCLPSTNESFSRVIMESWLHKTPVLVNGNCAVTKEFCLRSNGGLYFDNYDEFESCVKFYLENPEIRKKLGENGESFVRQNFNWEKVIQDYTKLFDAICS